MPGSRAVNSHTPPLLDDGYAPVNATTLRSFGGGDSDDIVSFDFSPSSTTSRITSIGKDALFLYFELRVGENPLCLELAKLLELRELGAHIFFDGWRWSCRLDNCDGGHRDWRRRRLLVDRLLIRWRRLLILRRRGRRLFGLPAAAPGPPSGQPVSEKPDSTQRWPFQQQRLCALRRE